MGLNVRSVQVAFLFLAILAFDPLRNRMQRLVDGVFDRDRSRYRVAVREISEAMVSMLSLREIGDRILVALTDTMGVERAMVLLFDEGDRVLRPMAWRGDWDEEGIATEIPAEHSIWKHLWMRREELSRVDFDDEPDPENREACWDVFDTLEVELLVPILFGVDLLGVIAVGRKMSGERLVADDRQLLRTLANQSSIAIENAKAFDEIAKLNETLEARVEERTRELRETQDQLMQSEKMKLAGPAGGRRGARAEQPDRLRPREPAAARRVHPEAGRGPADQGEHRAHPRGDRQAAVAQPRGHGAREGDRAGPARPSRAWTRPSCRTRTCTRRSTARSALMEPRFKGGIEVERDFGELPRVRCYPGQLNQVFMNLLMNACDELDELGKGGTIRTVRTGRSDLGVRLQFHDDGPGIPPDVREPASSSRSSRPSPWVRARDWASRSPTASSSATADASRSSAEPGERHHAS